MKQARIIILWLIVLSLSSCNPFQNGQADYRYNQNLKQYQEAEPGSGYSVNGDRLDDIHYDLTTIKRDDDQGLEATKDYILNVLGDDYQIELQEFDYNYDQSFENVRIILDHYDAMPMNQDYYKISDPEGENNRAYNIIAIKKSPKNKNHKRLILSAHYDTVSGSAGAYDNASGVAALLEVSKIISHMDMNIDLHFVFFSREEIGLIGSRYYVSQLGEEEVSDIIGNINVDCIGDRNSGELVLFTSNGLENDITKLIPLPRITSPFVYSDHSSFWTKKIPDVCISQTEVLNSNANSVNDNYDILNIPLMEDSTNQLLDVIINQFKIQK